MTNKIDKAKNIFGYAFGHMHKQDIESIIETSKNLGYANMHYGNNAILQANKDLIIARNTAFDNLPQYAKDKLIELGDS